MEPMAIATDPPPPAAPLIGPPAPPAEQGLWWEVLEESTAAPECTSWRPGRTRINNMPVLTLCVLCMPIFPLDASIVIEKKATPTEYTVESTHFIKLRLHNVSQTYTQTRVETPEFQYMGRTWCASLSAFP